MAPDTVARMTTATTKTRRQQEGPTSTPVRRVRRVDLRQRRHWVVRRRLVDDRVLAAYWQPPRKHADWERPLRLMTPDYPVSGGNIPNARELTAYNAALPDAANRILQIAEQQAEHRRRLERARLVATNRDQYLGMIFGFTICIAGIVAGAYVAVNASPVAGSVLSFGALGLLVTPFLKRHS